MALAVTTGSFTARTGGAGAQSVAHALGEVPKAAMFFTAGRSASGAHVLFGMGLWADNEGTFTQGACGYSALNGSDPTEVRVAHYTDSCFLAINHNASTFRKRANVSAVSATSIEFTYSDADANSVTVYYMLLGGDDVERAKVINITAPGATGVQAYSGHGFDPDGVMLIGAGADAAGSIQTTKDGHVNFGAWGRDAPFTTCSAASRDADNVGTASAAHVVRNNSTVGETGGGSNVAAIQTPTDGFSLNWTTLGRASARYAALMVKGPDFATGTFTSPAADGLSAITGVPFAPSAGVFAGCGSNAAINTPGNDGRFTMGVASGTGSNGTVGHQSTHATLAHAAFGDQESGQVIKTLTAGGSVGEKAALDSFDSAGYTLSWDKQVTAVATNFVYFAIGPKKDQTALPVGIESGEAFGIPSVVGPITPVGIESGESFGVPSIAGGVQAPPPMPEPEWQVAFHDMEGNSLGEVFEAQQRNFKFNLNHASTATIKLDIRNPMVPKILERGGEGYLTIWHKGVLRMTAEIASDELATVPQPGTRQPALQITATETMWPILQGRLIGKSSAGFSVEEPTDRGEVLADLMTTLNDESHTTLVLASNDDLPTMSGGPWHYKPYLELMTELSATVNGFDFWQQPVDPSELVFGVLKLTGVVNLYATKGETKPGVILEFGTGRNNAREYRWLVDKTRSINRAFALPADFPNNAGLEVVSAEDAASITARGLREEVVSTDLIDATLRTQLCQEHVDVRAAPMQRFTILPVVGGVGAPVPFEDYELGDIVEGRVLDQGIVMLNGLVRVWGIEVNIDEQGLETDTLTFVEES